jgi:hypothetical protein
MKAFPLKAVNKFDDSEGMDLRDYFAAKAIQGLLASNVNASVDSFAEKAYEIADAMMKEREQ